MQLIIDAYFPGYIPSSKKSVYTPEERELIRLLTENRSPMPTLVPESEKEARDENQ